MKRYSGVALLLGVLLCSVAAWAQATEPTEAEADGESAVLAKAVNGFFECAQRQDAAGLTQAIAPEAQILLAYQGEQFLSREDFVTFATSESIATLTVSDLECRVLAGLGFAYGKMSMPGFVDGFFYGVFTKSGDSWVVSLLTIDPMSAFVAESEVTEIEGLVKAFGEEAAEGAKQGSLQPVKDRIDAEHAVLLVSVGQMLMPPAIGRDAVLTMLGMAESQMSQMPANAQLPILPTAGEDVPYPHGMYVGNNLVVVWAEPTVSMTPGSETPVCSALMGRIVGGELKIIGMAVSVDLAM